MIKVFYDSRTGLGKKFAEKLPFSSYDITETPDSPCILVTRNIGLGQIPKSTKIFLDQHKDLVKGVVVNGNKRFGKFYCGASPKIEKSYHVPIIRNIEEEGNKEDVQAVVEYIRKLEK